MTIENGRPGVTPGIYEQYAERTAATHAVFVLPHLRPGTTLLDVGCGLGSITVGLAKAVAPGRVVGIDLDGEAIGKARTMAAERGVPNVEFWVGSSYELPFEDGTFDSAFGHMVLFHLENPARALREVNRILKPGGLAAFGERAEQGDLRGNTNETMERAWGLFTRWHAARGSNMRLGPTVPRLMLETGFAPVMGNASYDAGSTGTVASQFATFYREPGIIGSLVERGWTDDAGVKRIQAAIDAYAADPASLWKLAKCEVTGWKPDTPRK